MTYVKICPKILEAAVKNAADCLWYLVSEVAELALFNDDPQPVKTIVAAISHSGNSTISKHENIHETARFKIERDWYYAFARIT